MKYELKQNSKLVSPRVIRKGYILGFVIFYIINEIYMGMPIYWLLGTLVAALLTFELPVYYFFNQHKKESLGKNLIIGKFITININNTIYEYKFDNIVNINKHLQNSNFKERKNAHYSSTFFYWEFEFDDGNIFYFSGYLLPELPFEYNYNKKDRIGYPVPPKDKIVSQKNLIKD